MIGPTEFTKCNRIEGRPPVLFLILSVLLILSLPSRAATVTGLVQNVKLTAYSNCPVIFIPQNTPLALGTALITGPRQGARSDVNGAFSINLSYGYYRAQFGPNDFDPSFLVGVPNNNNTYNILDLLGMTNSILAFELRSNKGETNGYPSLDSDGYVPTNQIRPVVSAASEAYVMSASNAVYASLFTTLTNFDITTSNGLYAIIAALPDLASITNVSRYFSTNSAIITSNSLYSFILSHGTIVSNALAAMIASVSTTNITTNLAATSYFNNFFPRADSTYDLGGSSAYWRAAYVSNFFAVGRATVTGQGMFARPVYAGDFGGNYYAMGIGAAEANWSSVGHNVGFTNNAAGGYFRLAADFASDTYFPTGAVVFRRAVSGAAGSIITWIVLGHITDAGFFLPGGGYKSTDGTAGATGSFGNGAVKSGLTTTIPTDLITVTLLNNASNTLVSLLVANDTTTSNGLVGLYGPQVAYLSNNVTGTNFQGIIITNALKRGWVWQGFNTNQTLDWSKTNVVVIQPSNTVTVAFANTPAAGSLAQTLELQVYNTNVAGVTIVHPSGVDFMGAYSGLVAGITNRFVYHFNGTNIHGYTAQELITGSGATVLSNAPTINTPNVIGTATFNNDVDIAGTTDAQLILSTEVRATSLLVSDVAPSSVIVNTAENYATNATLGTGLTLSGNTLYDRRVTNYAHNANVQIDCSTDVKAASTNAIAGNVNVNWTNAVIGTSGRWSFTSDGSARTFSFFAGVTLTPLSTNEMVNATNVLTTASKSGVICWDVTRKSATETQILYWAKNAP